MSNVLRGLKSTSGSPRLRGDPVEEFVRNAEDARDIARDLRRRLPSSDKTEEEDTARHDAPPAAPQVIIHNHPSMPEIPDELAVMKKKMFE